MHKPLLTLLLYLGTLLATFGAGDPPGKINKTQAAALNSSQQRQLNAALSQLEHQLVNGARNFNFARKNGGIRL